VSYMLPAVCLVDDSCPPMRTAISCSVIMWIKCGVISGPFAVGLGGWVVVCLGLGMRLLPAACYV
jgi:hypothetical protein